MLGSEEYLDCKSVELGGDQVQRRCWLKSPRPKKAADKPPVDDAAADAACASSGSADATHAKACSGGNVSADVDDLDDEENVKKLEKRKYFSPNPVKWFPSQYALEYLNQDPEEVHAKLRKDWFCMDSECNRLGSEKGGGKFWRG